MRFKLIIEYDGSGYAGWQLQEKEKTIQGEIERALLQITGEKIRIHGAGRTDSGVHARGQVAHFDLSNQKIALHKMLKGLNAITGKTIAIKQIEPVSDDFHARFSATARLYRYYICQNYFAIGSAYCWQNMMKLDDDLINGFCHFIKTQNDFEAFCKVGADVKHYSCEIYESKWYREKNGMAIFEIKANRFLHGMVRTLMGTLIKVGTGHLNIEEVSDIFRSRDRRRAPMSVPAKGLFLEEIEYN